MIAFPLQRSMTSEDYLATLHKCVAVSARARGERDRRRRKVLVDQMKALYEQEVSTGGEEWVGGRGVGGEYRGGWEAITGGVPPPPPNPPSLV